MSTTDKYQNLIVKGDFVINENQLLDVPCGLKVDGVPVAPDTVTFEASIPLVVVDKRVDADPAIGSCFTVWNPTTATELPCEFTARRAHSEEGEPSGDQPAEAVESQLPAPPPVVFFAG